MLRVAELYSGTDTGRQRRHNEDAMFARSPLFVVADGMGGAQGGEVASRTAVSLFQHGLDDQGGGAEERLAARVQQANARIHELALGDAQLAGMGTTLTAAYVGPEEISIAHVGDSRAYCLRDGELIRLTDDHSLVDELIRQGRLTPEEAEEHPQRSVITRALGPEPVVEVDTRTHRARPSDVYLLCSDGLTTMISEERVAGILRSHSRLRDAGEELLAAANAAGGRDNITVVLFRVEDVSGAAAADDQPTTDHMAAPSIPAASRSALDSETEPPSTAPAAATAVRRLPRRPTQAPAARRRRRRRVLAPALGIAAVLAVIVIGLFVAVQSVYFIGTNDRGLVTVFRGVPYDLPGGLHLYSTEFVSGVSASMLPPSRRHDLLDHSLRSRGDATDLIRRIELGQVSAG